MSRITLATAILTASMALRVFASLLLADPGDMLPDVRHLEEIAVEAGLLDGPPEGHLVHTGRAGGHDDAVEPLAPDRLLDLLLPRLGTGIHVIGGIDDTWKGARLLRDLRHVDGARDIVAAVADKYADSHLRRTPSVSPGTSGTSSAVAEGGGSMGLAHGGGAEPG